MLLHEGDTDYAYSLQQLSYKQKEMSEGKGALSKMHRTPYKLICVLRKAFL